MSEPSLSLDQEPLSPDMFSDTDTVKNSTGDTDETSSTSIGINEPEPTNDSPEWKGISMDDIYKGLGPFSSQELPPICPSTNHTVLITLPLPGRGPPKPYPAHRVDKWCDGYVRMPHSVHSLCPTEEGTGNRHCRNRWEMIQETLLQSYVSSHQLETAILSYNKSHARRWDFSALHHFFSEVVDENEAHMFFSTLLPKMVQLALQLPVLITGPIPLLKRHTNACITFSQLQVASLLANAFFCTFPRRNSSNPQSEYAFYPHINFNRLFSALRDEKYNRCRSLMEKLKCIFHYFRRVTSKAPEGVITIQRRYVPRAHCPKWETADHKLPPLHITSRGTIETEGAGLLQVDFANKYLGGGVLGLGCVQEEIRFVTCPELMVTMLVTEVLDDTEALIVSGVERYSKYQGYSNTFKWTGDFIDETPRDSSGRRMTSVVAIDALYFKEPSLQFQKNNITRELNKAYVGFVGCEELRDNLPAIATGNWGCGAFRGNPKLKVLLQLMAAAAAGRSLVYFTFGDNNLRDEVAEMYWHLVRHNIEIGNLFSILCQYQESAPNRHLDFYQFLYNRCKMKSSLEAFLKLDKKVPCNESISTNLGHTKEKNNGHHRFYLSAMQKEDAKESTIRNWIESLDENTEDEKVMPSTGNCNNEDKIENSEDKEKSYDNRRKAESIEKNRENLLNELLGDKIQESREKRISSLDVLSGRNHVTNEFNISKVEKDEFNSNVSKPDENTDNNVDLKKQSFSPNKLKSPVKKSAQKKISDFFPRKS